ncbi:MAG TPA: hypothetical protein EYP41_18095 [Anaerolineae bacterium]|nr:hypothetical protein [Anaerolineae bacterium]HIP70222.1 hypothetical protein [Anaerolineae bacterium]
MTETPIFIVGAPRSGTTLLAAALATHSRISCGPETHFFRRLSERKPDELLADWPNRAADFICSIKHSGFTGHESKLLIEKYDLQPEEIAAFLAGKAPAVPNILASVTGQHMIHMGKQRWAEKTPDHLAHVTLIRHYFPDAPIIRIIRDPRDMALSLTRVPWGAGSFFEGLLFWRRADQISRDFFATDENSFTLRFEDLLSAPRETLQQLCRFIGEEFEAGMLDTSQTGKQVNSRGVPWKAKVSQPFDPGRIGVWRQEISQADNQLAEAVLGDRLAEYGYPRDETFTRLGELFPASGLAVKYEAELKAIAGQGVRFWPVNGEESPSVKIFLGDPAANQWLAQGGGKIKNAFSISTEIVKAHMTKNQIYWIPGGEGQDWSGYLAFGLKKMLGSHKVAVRAS